MTIKDVLDRRHALLRDRWQTAERLGLFDLVVAAALLEEMSFLLDAYQSLVHESRRGKSADRRDR